MSAHTFLVVAISTPGIWWILFGSSTSACTRAAISAASRSLCMRSICLACKSFTSLKYLRKSCVALVIWEHIAFKRSNGTLASAITAIFVKSINWIKWFRWFVQLMHTHEPHILDVESMYSLAVSIPSAIDCHVVSSLVTMPWSCWTIIFSSSLVFFCLLWMSFVVSMLIWFRRLRLYGVNSLTGPDAAVAREIRIEEERKKKKQKQVSTCNVYRQR